MFDTAMIRPEYRQKWASSLKDAANFFKHGRHDADKILEFDPTMNEYVLMASGHGLSRMGEEPGMEELAFGYWIFFTRPDLFNDREVLLANPKVKALQDIVPNGSQIFLREFEKAWNAGTIRR